MATVQDRQRPNAGTKVDLGENAPVKQEGAGYVEQGSLAAESYRADGEFADNKNAESTNAPYSVDDEKSYGGQAPTYVNSQYTDAGGPHGDNVKEGFRSEGRDGIKVAFNSEPGSINDPARLAEQKFEQKDAELPKMGTTRDQDLSTGSTFDNLKRDDNA